MALVTTGRKPCMRSRAFARELASVLPLSKYAPRGKKSVEGLISQARALGFGRIAIISDMKGNPGKIEFLEVSQPSWDWLPTVLVLRGVKLQREFGARKANEDNEIALQGGKTVAGLLGVEEFPEAEIVMGDEDGRVTFLLEGMEIGPSFRYEAKPWK